MEINEIKLPDYFKFSVHVAGDELAAKKKKYFERVKEDLPEKDGFRKGHYLQADAERIFGVNQLYTPIIDDIYYEIVETKELASIRSFKVGGSFEEAIDIEFIAESKAKIKSFNLDSYDIKWQEASLDSSEVDEQVEKELQNKEVTENSTKEISENGDIVIIDFEGSIDGKLFKNGTAKNFKVKINSLVNGKRALIDGFEDQLVGMKVGQKKDVCVIFPKTYGEKSLAGQRAKFKTTLVAIQEMKTISEEELLKRKGFSNLEEFKKSTAERMLDFKKKDIEDDFKRRIVKTLVEGVEFDGMPFGLIDEDLESQWRFFLQRINQTEEQYLKENKEGKTTFIERMFKPTCEKIISMAILLEVAKKEKIELTEEELEKYIENTTNQMKYDDAKKENIKKSVKSKNRETKFIEESALIEKVTEYLSAFYKKKS